MTKYEQLDLYEHNILSYEKVKKQFEKDNIAAIIHATGTGKSFNALQLALDNKDKKIIYVVPYASIIEHEKELIEQNEKVNLEKDFPNLEFRTYQSFINMSEEEIKKIEVDLLILDEFHHIGAPVWGARINTLIETHKNLQIFGMTAYTVRDRGTSYERDMINPETDELFANKVVSTYDLCDAMIDGVLPKPNYKSGYVYLEKTCKNLEEKIKSLNPNSKDYKDLMPLLIDIKKRLHEAPSVKDIFKQNIKPDGKYIYFCPLNSEEGVNDIPTIMEETKKWLKEMGLKEEDYELYMTTSEMKELGKKNRNDFYNDKDLEGNSTKNKLRIMFAINQYNEGVHTPGLDGVIMARSTQSDIVFFEQLGRALSVGKDNKKEYEKLSKLTKEELIKIFKQKELLYKDDYSKEMLIDILLAPTIIDLSNNIGFIKELENNLKDRVKEIQISKESNKREIHLGDTTFNIDMLNEDLFKIIEYMRDRLIMTWEDKYELAKKYYEHYGNLNIPFKFRTINGYEYDENGIALGSWILCQRRAYFNKSKSKLLKDQIKLLESIGMIWNPYKDNWNKKYELAKIYYEHYGNLNIPRRFKTINGYDYDENGISLGNWIGDQRKAYKGKYGHKINEEQKKLLDNIGMIWDTLKGDWNKKYELAKIYYEYHGNLNIHRRFKTINGYEYDENGILLGSWINIQKSAYKGNGTSKISKDQIKLLDNIGMIWDTLKDDWNKNYELAKVYYEYYGNLNIPRSFKTINGYEFDEKGIKLGAWIGSQRTAYKGRYGHKITEKQIKLLENIGMIWFDEKKDLELQKEIINDKNTKKKQKEILNRMHSLLNNYNGDTLPTKEKLNDTFIKKLTK